MRILKHAGLALAAVLIAWGCNDNSTKPQPKQSFQEERANNPQLERTPAPVQQDNASGELDKYGRKPGDAHYGHDHPLLEEELNNQGQQGNPAQQASPMQTQPDPASGELDKYGRKPGDAHYGHDHPLLEEELNNQ